ncbi:hypothetical protein M426DRAFT_20988 [Hypoxylon sp. CI-4A]|nr:hypothetical protein M426DRAFT_20988 [Hypoxylon sp. CI-4A]
MSSVSSQGTNDTVVSGRNYYTNLHLSAVATLYPPTPRNIKLMCDDQPARKAPKDQRKIARIYYAEPSYYGYNPGCYLIKETRYSSVQDEWHPASDELVADDAAPGTPVIAIGWWLDSDDGLGLEDIWERINRSNFNSTLKDDFDSELPKPEELAIPIPGWKRTPLASGDQEIEFDETAFPAVSPLPNTKLAAVRSDNGEIYLFYQDGAGYISALTFQPGKGWKQAGGEVVYSDPTDLAKPGTPLTATVGGYSEVRLFFVTPQDQLMEVFRDDHTSWTKTEIPPYILSNPTAMISAVAWNYATIYFQIRIFVLGGNDKPLAYAFSRKTGWAEPDPVESGLTLREPTGPSAPLSAIAALMLEDECNPRVYFHPRRTVAEWDVCKKVTFFIGLSDVGEKSSARRKIENETRLKIQEEEEEREKERLRKERRRLDEERRRREEIEGPPLTDEDKIHKQELMAKPVGHMEEIRDGALLARMQKKSGCTQGYQWTKEVDGWKCGGGGHFISDADFAAL